MSFLELAKARYSVRKFKPDAIEDDALEAFERGIGSCWGGAFAADAIEEALSLPDNVRVTAMLPLGYSEPDAFHSAIRELSDTVEFL